VFPILLRAGNRQEKLHSDGDELRGAAVRHAVARGGVALVLVCGAAPAMAPSAAAAPGTCEDFFVVGARGSGEAQDERGGFGIAIEPFVTDLRAALAGAAAVGAEAVTYPALSIPDLLSIGGTGGDPGAATESYDASVAQGGVAGADILDRQAAACPDQKFVLAGYSQGADVIGNVIGRRPGLYGRIAAVALFGDPRFDPATSAPSDGGATSGRGIAGIARVIPPELADRYRTVCLANDIVCQGVGEGNSPGRHLLYAELGLTAQIATETAQRLRAAAPGPQPPPPTRTAGAQGDRLPPGQFLLRGDYLQSPNGAYRLVLQADGNLVTYRTTDNTVAWTTGQPGGTRAVMQADGGFVVESGRLEEAPTALWFDPYRRGLVAGTTAVLQDDGNFVGTAPDGQVTFASSYNTEGKAAAAARAAKAEEDRTSLQPGRALNLGEFIESPNRSYVLTLQTDGNATIVRRSDNRPIWQTRSGGNRPYTGQGRNLVMQPTGELIVYGDAGRIAYTTNTKVPGSAAYMQDDGNLVVYTPDKRVAFTSNTADGRVQPGVPGGPPDDRAPPPPIAPAPPSPGCSPEVGCP
jgi:hypothetical protein